MGKIDHSTAGAIHAVNELNNRGRILAYIIAGHHSGLPDWSYDDARGGPLHERLDKKEIFKAATMDGSPPETIRAPMTSSFSTPCIAGENSQEFIHLWIRMLFSCLVDADGLDTEAFMSPEKSEARGRYPEMSELKERFDSFMEEKQKNAPKTPINQKRKEILEQCRNKASESPGVFSLTVPTGGGKTLASMGFALEHALKHGKKRIIVVIPYTSIIEQTAKQLREIFGEDSVLEHHSNLDPDKETKTSSLVAENWDAPIIVTTNVQFFESLFASRVSACRKIHNIVNSVVILDEAQTLPTDFLQPIVSMMKGLCNHFKTTFVLCTATQPILNKEIKSGMAILNGFEKVTEIMKDPKELYESFQRVTLSRVDGCEIPTSSLEEIADQIIKHPQVLCIVSTRKRCRELYDLVLAKPTDGVDLLHLSALMCPEHRSDVIAKIKEKLPHKEKFPYKEKLPPGDPIRVISTQVVEAGVDIDFPVVFRELAGLDSIAQAAGRCNREGKLPEKGKVFIFNAGHVPQGQFTKARQACEETLRHIQPGKELEPGSFEKYFSHYFHRLNSFDQKHIMTLLTNDAAECKIQFRTAGMRFKLIDDSNQHAIIVRYKGERGKQLDSNVLLAKLKEGTLSVKQTRETLRRLQRFSVTVHDREFEDLKQKGYIEKFEFTLAKQNKKMHLWVTVEKDKDRDFSYDNNKGLKVNTDKDS